MTDTVSHSSGASTPSKVCWIFLNPIEGSATEQRLFDIIAEEKAKQNNSNYQFFLVRSMSEFLDLLPELPDQPTPHSTVFLLAPELLGNSQGLDATGMAFLQVLFDQPRFNTCPFLVLDTVNKNLLEKGLRIEPPAPARSVTLPQSFADFESLIKSHLQIRQADCFLKFSQGCAIVYDQNPESLRQICIYLEQTSFGPIFGASKTQELQALIEKIGVEPGILILGLESDSQPQQHIIRWVRRQPILAGSPILGIRPQEKKLETDSPMASFSFPPDALIGKPFRPLQFFQATQETHKKISEMKQFQRLIAQGYQALDQGKASSAKMLFQRAEILNPRLAESAFCLGLAHSLAGETNTAIEYFQKSLRLKPQYEEAILAFSLQLFKLGYQDEAFELLLEGQSQLNKSSEIPLFGLKKSLELKKFSLSQRFLKRLKIISPNHPELATLEIKSAELKKSAA